MPGVARRALAVAAAAGALALAVPAIAATHLVPAAYAAGCAVCGGPAVSHLCADCEDETQAHGLWGIEHVDRRIVAEHDVAVRDFGQVTRP